MRRQASGLAALLVAAMSITACGSADKKAATAASIAENALDQGQLAIARQYIQQALAERDDVSDYWLLLAHINIAANDGTGAFNAYQNVLTLDRGNVEALTTLCQLGLSGNAAARVEKYAEQLALVNPASTLPPVITAAAALERGDKQKADHYLQQVLDKHPTDLGALMIKSRLLAASDRWAEGAAIVESTLSATGDPNSRLNALKDLYRKAKDRAGYKRTVARLARANPKDADKQLDYADALYDDGERDEAYSVTRTVLATRPGDLGAAASVLNLWLKQDMSPTPSARLLTDSSNLDVEAKAVYAQYANETGRPDLASTILGNAVAADAPNPKNSDAKAAAAYAVGLRGNKGGALAALAAILRVDPSQPSALLAQARLRPDLAAAIGDARKVVADDDGNVAARLTLVDLLLRRGDQQLAEDALREGMNVNGGDPRLAMRLERLLTARGDPTAAATVLSEFARDNPVSLRATTLVPSHR